MNPVNTILVTGGAGSVGRDVTSWLLSDGYQVRVLDRDTSPLKAESHERLSLMDGLVEDRDILRKAIKGVDAVIHLAWSFSNDPVEVLEGDLKGHIYLLEEMSSEGVKHLLYTSTAVVYGKPGYSPIDEDHPLIVEEARKPLYGITKAAAEKLCLMYWKQKNVASTIFRFWWAFGDVIGGKHLREMLKTASEGRPLIVPADSGGSFVHTRDLLQALGRSLLNGKAYGKTFNVATVYVTWQEVARMVSEATGGKADVKAVPVEDWTGSAFLADPWELSCELAGDLLGFSPMDGAVAKESLKSAIFNCWEAMDQAG